MIGGVIAHHPFIKTLLEKKLGQSILTLNDSQHVVSLGAALQAREHFLAEAKSDKHTVEAGH